MASGSTRRWTTAEIDRLAMALAKGRGQKVFIPLAEEYGKAGRWEDAVVVLEDGLKTYPGFITAMVALGRAYEQVNQPVKARPFLRGH
ncbi:MAG: tetratricopeptide repeat protein [Nitrospira sp.]